MKLNFVVNLAFLLFVSLSFSQDFQSNLSSVRSIDNQIQEEEYSTSNESSVNRLILESSTASKEKGLYSKKEWRKIKKQLRKNKKRVFSFKNNIHTSKTIDTIHINIPVYDKNTRLSSW